jgi:hypothetical protein
VRTGINLSSHPHRAVELPAVLLWAPLLALLLLSAVHFRVAAGVLSRQQNLRQAIGGGESALGELEERAAALRGELRSAEGARTAHRLEAFARAGAATGVAPARILEAVVTALPAEARVVSFLLHLEREAPALDLDVAGSGADTASRLAARLRRSEVFESAELLDERLLDTGEYRFRLTAAIRRAVTH